MPHMGLNACRQSGAAFRQTTEHPYAFLVVSNLAPAATHDKSTMTSWAGVDKNPDNFLTGVI
jgi:hypothetical protein